LRDNIRIGHPETPETSPEVERAACDAGLGPLIKSWPQGLDTRLGRWLHDGIEPSIGQWQKIALARAFLRPALLTILDERPARWTTHPNARPSKRSHDSAAGASPSSPATGTSRPAWRTAC
jgi:ABC-type transport system involved in cytochrome bd biosynthesis fused ATPase/permease subunit